jgi:exonuclease VII large subunit
MNTEQSSNEDKVNNRKEAPRPFGNETDLGNEKPGQGTEEALTEIEKKNEKFLPEAEQRIESEAEALGVTSENLEENLKDQGVDAKLQKIQDKADQLEKKTKEKILFEKERMSVPESIISATSAAEIVVRVRPDFDALRDFLIKNGYKIKEHPGREGVPFQIIAEDIYEVDDRTFAIEIDSPIYQKLLDKGLVETVFVVEDASEKNLVELEELEEQNESYSKGKDKYGQTVHKRGSYLIYEESVPLLPSE